ncbi:MAG: T9SS type A sorting domain-containing protein, partial [Candidatus Cloacimonetes bacterium]|nr:T9SS type A sorting domain-containing protein [Candidatus Cloacimonadota bacterium]
NLTAAMIFLDRPSSKMVTGIITDENGLPLIADVVVAEIDTVSGMTLVEPVRSDSLFGRYYRLLHFGTYTMQFSKPGYITQIVDSVVVNANSITTLNVILPVSTAANDSNTPYLKLSNYPNPFNPETTIEFNLDKSTRTELSVYNIKGQLVKTLVNQCLKSGVHRIHWDGKDDFNHLSASGIYFFKLKYGGETTMQKATLLK